MENKRLKHITSTKLDKLVHSAGELSMLQIMPIAPGYSPQVTTTLLNCEVNHDNDLAAVLKQYSTVFKDI